MNLKDITLVIGIDRHHLEELRWAWPTWMKFKPELLEMPAIVFYDSDETDLAQAGFLDQHPNLRLVPWRMANARNQREEMITGFVHVPSREVATPWYLKLDTDTIATGPGEWIKPEWFAMDEQGTLPAFISCKWHYSKPRYAIDLLDDWGDKVEALARRPRLNVPYSSQGKLVRHKRIISWIFFGNTAWTRMVAEWVDPDGRLPFPSQDTFMSFCARRLGSRIVRERMGKHYQWTHLRFTRMKERVLEMGMTPVS